MSSIKSVGTLALLVVMGAGLYMIINSPEPVPPAEVGGEALTVPEIEDGLEGLLVDDGQHDPAAAGNVPAFVPAGDATEPPAWSQPSSDGAVEDLAATDSSNPGLPQLPQAEPGSPVAGADLSTTAASPSSQPLGTGFLPQGSPGQVPGAAAGSPAGGTTDPLRPES